MLNRLESILRGLQTAPNYTQILLTNPVQFDNLFDGTALEKKKSTP